MKLLILDRDGVINEDSDAYIKTLDEWRPIPGSLAAIGRLTAAGYTVVVATNQSGVARGMFDLPTLEAMHAKMDRLLAEHGGRVDRVFFCPHGPTDGCTCRKPRPGLFRQIAEHYGAGLDGVPAIGDSLRDLDAAQAVGARPILVLTGKGLKTRERLGHPSPFPVYPDLAAAVDALLAESSEV